METKPNALRNVAFSSVSVYLEYLFGLVVSIVIARALGPEQYGVYSYIVWLSAFAIVLVNSGVSVGAIKFFSEVLGKRRGDLVRPMHRYLARVQVTKALVFVAAFSLLITLYPALLIDEGYAHLLWLIVPVVMFKSYHMYRVGIFKGLQTFQYLAATVVFVSPINLAAVIAVYYLYSTITGYLLAFLLASFAYWFVSYFGTRAAFAPYSDSAQTAPVLEPTLKARVNGHLRVVSVISVMSFVVFGQSELFFLKHFASLDDIAFFNIGFVLTAAAMALVPGVYNNLVLSQISHSVADTETSEADIVIGASRYLFILGALVGVPLSYYAEEVVALLYGAEFAPAADVLRIFVLLAIFRRVRDSTNAYLMSVDRQTMLLKAVSAALIATLTLDYVLISGFGLWGAVAAYAVVDLTMTLVLSLYAFKLLSKWPNFRKLGGVLLAAIVAIGLTALFDRSVDFGYSFVPGGLLYAASYLLLLVLFDCLEKQDYLVLRRFLDRLDLSIFRFAGQLVTARINRAD